MSIAKFVGRHFVTQYFPWSLKSEEESKKNARYRIRDSYLKFHLKFIYPKTSNIIKDKYLDIDITSLRGLDTVMGLQFETFVINNYKMLYQCLNVNSSEIILDGPFLQNKTTKQQGCQIDYLLQTKYKTLYACEIKFSRNPLGVNVANSMKEKIGRLKLPHGFSCIPILIHANHVSTELLELDYFVHIINVCDWLS